MNSEQFGQIRSLFIHMNEVFPNGTWGRWFHTSSRYLDGKTPNEVLKSGDIDKVHRVLFALDAGVYV